MSWWRSDFQMLVNYNCSLNQEVFCSTKTLTLSREREAGPVLGLKDRCINLLLTPFQAGLKCLPILSLYKVDKRLEKQDYIH